MNKTFACFGGCLVLLPVALARPEPNAFLNKTAPNLEALIRQVKTDPQVYNRFHRHFGMNKAELIGYFSTLKLAKITKPGAYVVYNVRETDGIIMNRVFNLKAGSLIYVDMVGKPVLKKICGNPMTKGPTQLTVVTLMETPPVATPNDIRPVEEEVTPEPVVPTDMMVVEEMAEPPFTPEPVVPPVVPPVEPPIYAPPIVKPQFEAPGFNWLLPLLSGGVILGLDDGGGGGTAVIPEPGTMIAVGSCFALYFARRRKK